MNVFIYFSHYFIGIALIFLSLIVISTIQYFGKSKKKKKLYEMLLFDPDGIECVPHFTLDCQPCHSNCVNTKFRLITDFLDKAEHSIIMYVRHITLAKITNVLISKHVDGLNVKIMVDSEMAKENDSTTHEFNTLGIPICYMGDEIHGLNGNNIIVIDQKISMNGSLDMTLESFCENYEHLLISDNEQMAKTLHKYLEQVWRRSYRRCG